MAEIQHFIKRKRKKRKKRKEKQKYIIKRSYTENWNHVRLLCCLSDKDILFAWWLWWWWWLEILGRDEVELFEWCLLIIIKAVVAEEGGVLLPFGWIWLLEDVVGLFKEEEAPTPTELFDVVRCFEEAVKSAWDWDRPNGILFDLNFDTIVEDDGTEGVFNVWRIWLESFKSDSYVALFERLGVLN